ncbi:MAG: hypothetical protein VXV96_14655 [Bdellovibrionota bacterium]|nr:hypothetical protein [Bdellovibrionota bacterium]
MKAKEIIKKVWSYFYGALFSFGVFAITYTLMLNIYNFVIQNSGISLFDEKGNLDLPMFNPLYIAIMAIIFGSVGWYYLDKKKWIRKISPIVVLLFFPFFWIAGHMSHFSPRSLEHSPERLKILKGLHGIKADPCEAIKIGDHYDDVVKVYGGAQLASYTDAREGLSGKKVISHLFQAPYQSPLFSIYFEAESMKVMDVECFSGKWKKAKGAKANTAYTYYDEAEK